MDGNLNQRQIRLSRNKKASRLGAPLARRRRTSTPNVSATQTISTEPCKSHNVEQPNKVVSHIGPSTVDIVGPENLATDATVEPVDPKDADVSAAIGQVFLSKTEARQRRRQERLLVKPYHVETRRPLVCLAFVFPMLVFYEVGAILLGQDSLRSGIDQWFHQILIQFGAGQLVLLPLVTVGIILTWHHQQHDHWRIRIPVLLGMLGEAVGLGGILFCLANSLNLLSGGVPPGSETAIGITSTWLANAVSYVGSGIYEELIFRILLLVPAIHLISKHLFNRNNSILIAVVLVSLVFAALHYNFFNPAGNPFELSSFLFRFAASIVFCFLFLFRGFGIAVGTHVAYDVLTQV